MKIKIAPSLLACNFLHLAAEIEKCNQSNVELIHIDVMDGHFVPNITIGAMFVSAIKQITNIPIDCHLMISHPDRYLLDFINAGADMISVHAETTPHLHRTINFIKQHNVKAGVALNPLTSLNFIYDAAEFVDFILLMSVNPGFGGQSFMPLVYDKISDLKKNLINAGSNAFIQVDGGVEPTNAAALLRAGADVLVSGSAFFKFPPYSERLKTFQAAADSLNA